ARLMGRADLIDEPRYRDHHRRYKIIDEVDQLVGAWVAERERDALVDLLIAHGVPCAPVRTITEVATDAELRARGLLRVGEFAGHGDVNVLGSAIKMASEAAPTLAERGCRAERAGESASCVQISNDKPRVPTLGEDTDGVLARLGVDQNEISELRRDGVI
ncbi:MAG: CoA transferase, partial [Candidatus Binataceae bacterium]